MLVVVSSVVEEEVFSASACWYLSCEPQKVVFSTPKHGVGVNSTAVVCIVALLAAGFP